MAALVVILCGGIYLVLSRETPILSSLPFVSTYTLGLVGVLFFSGISVGAALAIGGWLDRFDSTTTNAMGRRSPTVALGFIAVANFWAAALLYLVVEELLVEAHEEAETPLLGALFFVGFLGLYLLAAIE